MRSKGACSSRARWCSGCATGWASSKRRRIPRGSPSPCRTRAGVTVVPAFVGLGAPHWDPECRGTIGGITRGTTAAHIVRAALESVALQTFDVVHAMEQDRRAVLTRLCVDGGMSANDFLMQFQADILGTEVVRPAVQETTALGAAYLAGLACGYYRDVDSLRRNGEEARVFAPQMEDAARAEKLRAWEEALGRAMYRAPLR